MRVFETRDGARMPAFGVGTWLMGEDAARQGEEVAALRLALDLGITLIDTAEMYANGGSERVVGDAIRGRRGEVFVVSKVLPGNASRRGTIEACERSLDHLGTDVIDLYLLHWPGSHPVEDTLAAFVELKDSGKIRHYGISNFDLEQTRGASALPGGADIGVNQVLYNLQRRGIERDLLPWCQKNGVVVMAYSPLEQGRLPTRGALEEVARRHGVSAYQVALAWTLRHEGLVSIVKAGRAEHVRDNVAATELALDPDDLATLDRDFPVPSQNIPLETL